MSCPDRRGQWFSLGQPGAGHVAEKHGSRRNADIAISSVYTLRTFKEKQTGSRTMISLNKSSSYTIGVWNQCRGVHGQLSDPFLVDIQHMNDQISGTF
jgi:hypothetical protein